jgi:hypothetical protein
MPRVTLAVVVLVIGLPLVGAWIGGRNLAELFRFPPPLALPLDYVRFSWGATIAVLTVLVAAFAPWIRHLRRTCDRLTPAPSSRPSIRRSPLWMWVALFWTAGWWVLAWHRWAWFEPLQRYTFFPLWFGFIVLVNGATERRTGSCLMRRAPARWLALFAASAACWWVFEWLNRFVRNWHYLNVADFGPLGYAVHATVCFATVLPAVSAAAEWLDSHPRWTALVAHGPAWRWLGRRDAAVVLALMSFGSLVATGIWPNWTYPSLWISPLAICLAASILDGRRGLAREIAEGNWTRAGTWMIAALACGFFWELWNWRSAAKWIYTVPGVERWHVFEMPALGYAGYLGFGLECLLVTEWVMGSAWPAAPSTRESNARG